MTTIPVAVAHAVERRSPMEVTARERLLHKPPIAVDTVVVTLLTGGIQDQAQVKGEKWRLEKPW